VVYKIFPRNFSPEGNFDGITVRLDELKSLGVDILWLMPIHPYRNHSCIWKWFYPTAFGGSNYSNTPVGALGHSDESGVADELSFFRLSSA